MRSTVIISFLYRLFTAHAKRSCPHRSDRKKREEKWIFIFIFLPPDSPDYTDQRNIYIFFFSSPPAFTFTFTFFIVRLKKYRQIKIQSILGGLCLASPTINVKFRDAKTGTDAALTGSGFRWKREYLHVYSDCRFRREWSADLEGKGWKIINDSDKRTFMGWCIWRLGFSEDKFVIFIQLNE